MPPFSHPLAPPPRMRPSGRGRDTPQPRRRPPPILYAWDGVEPPLYALRRDPASPRPPRDPNAACLPDSTSALVGPRLSLHNRVQSLVRSDDLESASATARHAVFSSVRPTVFTCNTVMASMLRARCLDDAVALFTFFFNQSNIVPNIVSYNILINTHSSGRSNPTGRRTDAGGGCKPWPGLSELTGTPSGSSQTRELVRLP